MENLLLSYGVVMGNGWRAPRRMNRQDRLPGSVVKFVRRGTSSTRCLSSPKPVGGEAGRERGVGGPLDREVGQV